jgi:hypothetical protein
MLSMVCQRKKNILMIGTFHFLCVGPTLTHPHLIALPVNTFSEADGLKTAEIPIFCHLSRKTTRY